MSLPARGFAEAEFDRLAKFLADEAVAVGSSVWVPRGDATARPFVSAVPQFLRIVFTIGS